MEGRLGAIYIGKKQIGGFIDWYVKVNLTDGVDDDNRTHKLQSWKIRTWAHWLVQALPVDTKVRLKLCPSIGDVYWECDGKVFSRATSALNTLVHAPLDFMGNSEIEGKRLEE